MEDWNFISQWDVDQAAATTATNSTNANIAKTNSDESDNDKTFVQVNSPVKKALASASPEPMFDKMTAKGLNATAKSLSDAALALKNTTNSFSFLTCHLLSGRP